MLSLAAQASLPSRAPARLQHLQWILVLVVAHPEFFGIQYVCVLLCLLTYVCVIVLVFVLCYFLFCFGGGCFLLLTRIFFKLSATTRQ